MRKLRWTWGDVIENIKSYSSHFSFLFEQEEKAIVHSVYKSTINCLVKDRIVSLQHQEMPITPLSINLDIPKRVFELIRVNRGDVVQFNHDGLFAFNTMFYKVNTQSFDCLLIEGTSPLKPEAIPALTDLILSAIRKGEFGRIAQSLNDKQIIPLTFTGDYVLEVLTKILATDDLQQIGALSAQLIGIGEGLTPSGDDFNCGMLAAQFMLHGNERAQMLKQHLTRKIQYRVNTTTIISKELLMYASEGRFSQMVKNILINSNKEVDLTDDIKSICNVGHTSGVDFLTGLYFGLLKGEIK